MKQKISVGLVALLFTTPIFSFLSLVFPAVKVSAFTGTGAGTVGDPYQITTCDQLQEIDDNAAAHYILMTDINTSTCTNPFTPIVALEGSLVGNYHLITLNITANDTDHIGLFKVINGGSVSNLALTGSITTTVSNHVGSLSGSALNLATISKVASNVEVVANGGSYVGGLIGTTEDATITDSYFLGRVDADQFVGGLVGNAYHGTSISSSYAYADLHSVWVAGGLVGTFEQVNLNDSFSTSYVSVVEMGAAGAIGNLGDSSNSQINNIYYASNRIPAGAMCLNTPGEGYWPGGTEGCMPVDLSTDMMYFRGNSNNPPFDPLAWNFTTVWEIVPGDYPKVIDMPVLTPYTAEPQPLVGEGTQESPYLIGTCSDLRQITNGTSLYYKLTSNLSCSNWDVPIGQDSEGNFIGNLDGDGYTINYTSLNAEDGEGLFYELGDGAYIGDLTINAEFHGNNFYGDIGGLAAYADFAVIENVDITTTFVDATSNNQFDDIGGLIGNADDTVIRDVVANTNIVAEITGDWANIDGIGGLVGNAEDAVIEDVTVNGEIAINISGNEEIDIDFIGGVVGYEELDSTFTNVVSSVDINIITVSGNNTVYVSSIGGVSGTLCEDGGDYCDIDFSSWDGTMNITADFVSDIGGIVGAAYLDRDIFNPKLTENSAQGTININYTEETDAVGGLYGDLDDSIIQYNHSLVNINITAEGENAHSELVGGIIGFSEDSSVIDSFYRGNLIVQSADNQWGSGGHIGGLVGELENGDIKRSYAVGRIEYGLETNVGDHRALGGLVGFAHDGNDFVDSFAAVNIVNAGNVNAKGSIVGAISIEDDLTILNTYFDWDIAGLSNCVGGEVSMEESDECFAVNGENTQPIYFINNNFNSPLERWDFNNVWMTVEEDYPVLRTNINLASGLFSGQGTAENPYLITSCTELREIGKAPNAEFDLTQDIDCEGIEFTPIGHSENEIFRGSFDGNNHTIKNINIIKPSSDHVGLFAAVRDGELYNIVIDNIRVEGEDNVGTLAGRVENASEIENITVLNATIAHCQSVCGGLMGTARGNGVAYVRIEGVSVDFTTDFEPGYKSKIGGLIGEAFHINLTDSYAKGNIDVTLDFNVEQVGGLIGAVYGDPGLVTEISKTYADVDLNFNKLEGITELYLSKVGGFIGEGYYADVSDSYSEGNFIVAFDNIGEANSLGGFIGFGGDITISRSYTSVNLNIDASIINDVGGFMGNGDSDVTISDIFSAATLIVNEDSNLGYVGSFAGVINNTSAENSYFDAEKGTFNQYFGNEETYQGVNPINADGNQDDYFKFNSTNAPLNNWNFTEVWKTRTADYPILRSTKDEDFDGILNVIENSAPNGGDSNNDGILDSEQANVTSIFNPVSNNYSVLVSNCTGNFNVSVRSESDNESQDNAFEYTAGFLRFTLECEVGANAEISQYHYGNFDASKAVVRKYNSVTNTYSTIPGATSITEQIADNNVLKSVFNIQDGGAFDEDAAVNGLIVDPSGPGFSTVGVPNTGFKRIQ